MVEDRHIITSQRAIHGHYLRARFLQFNPTSLVLCVLVASFWEIVGQALINRSFHDLRIVEASNIRSVVNGSCEKWKTSQNGCFPFSYPVKDNETFFMEGCYCGLSPPISAGRRPVWDPDAGDIDSVPCKPDTYRPESTFRADDSTKTLCKQKRSCDGKGEIRVPGSSLTEDDTICDCQDKYQKVDGLCVLKETPAPTGPTTVENPDPPCCNIYDLWGWGMLGVVIFFVTKIIVASVAYGAGVVWVREQRERYTPKQIGILIPVTVLVSFILVVLLSLINFGSCIVEERLGPVFIVTGLGEVPVFIVFLCVIWPKCFKKGKKNEDSGSNGTGNDGIGEDVSVHQTGLNHDRNLYNQAHPTDESTSFISPAERNPPPPSVEEQSAESTPLTERDLSSLSGIIDDMIPPSGGTFGVQRAVDHVLVQIDLESLNSNVGSNEGVINAKK